MKDRSSPEERIAALASSQAIGDDEARGLIAAVRPSIRPSMNPFTRYGGETLTAVGALVALLGLAASRLGARFDGAIDLHFATVPSWSTAALDEAVAFPLAALVAWGVARAFATRARFVDVLGAVGAARLPAVLLAFPLAPLARHVMGAADPATVARRGGFALLGIALASLVASGLHVTLVVLGYRVATGLRGPRLAASVVAALVLAEIAAKAALFFVR